MKLKCINMVSTNPAALKDFYCFVLQAPCHEVVPGRYEIPVGEDVFVVITHTGVKTPVNPDCCGLEFTVDDVDAEYQRLLVAGVSIENEPVTYPWRCRAIGFRDPDGNFIDFVQNLQETAS